MQQGDCSSAASDGLIQLTADLLPLLLCVCRLLLCACVQRYDPVTTGLGSLLVTGYCVVAHHQSVGEALNIAACATVLGMVGGIWGMLGLRHC